jgi:hypothetical protein
MQKFSGKLVRLNVPEWFKDQEFQAWFNKHLGKGLATWQNAGEPLEPVNLPKADCKQLAEELWDDVNSADVLFEPIGVGTMLEIKGEKERLQEAEDALNTVHTALEDASKKDGLTPEMAEELAILLHDKVIGADVLFEPGAIADPEVLAEEDQRLDQANNTLAVVYERLHDCARKAKLEDRYAYADCFVGVDPTFSGEGTDSDMPEKFWNAVVEAARNEPGPNPNELHVLVWLCPTE